MTTVRLATREDEPEILRLLELMHAECGILSLDLQSARSVFARAFDRQGGIIGVVGPRDDIHAMIYLMLTRFWYTQDDHLEELFNFIRPDHRKSDYATTMIEFAKKCSDEIGVPLFIGVLTNQRMAGKIRLYRRSLGYPAGAFFVHNAQWQNGLPPCADDFRPAIETRSEEQRRRKRNGSAAEA